MAGLSTLHTIVIASAVFDGVFAWDGRPETFTGFGFDTSTCRKSGNASMTLGTPVVFESDPCATYVCKMMVAAEDCVNATIEMCKQTEAAQKGAGEYTADEFKKDIQAYADKMCACETEYETAIQRASEENGTCIINPTTYPDAWKLLDIMDAGCKAAKFIAGSATWSADNAPLLFGIGGGACCLCLVCVIGGLVLCCGGAAKALGKKRDIGDDYDAEDGELLEEEDVE